MKSRTILLAMITIFLLGAVLAGMATALEPNKSVAVETLTNVRDFAPAVAQNGVSYAVDGGLLFAGNETTWQRLPTPAGLIVNAVAVSSRQPELVYIGAANELAIYVSSDAGQSWMKIALATQAIGAVTDIAVDGANRLVYVGTDTDGVHRLRDVGRSMIAAGHLLLDEPVEEIVAASNGTALVRTKWHLYRAEEMGLRWVAVENLPSPATALAVSQTTPPTFYVGTAASGVRMSQDGFNWQSANTGLGFTPGSQLFVNDLAVDPAQPGVLYAATSLIFGSANAHTTPVGVAMSSDGAANWAALAPLSDVAVAMLLPVSGETGAVYALTAASRTPLALGSAPQMATVAAVESTPAAPNFTGTLAWVLAALAGIGLAVVGVMELRQRGGVAGKPGMPVTA
ncbi:MAG: hypothetical protein HY328_14775 [Chloroflexi bacterium]|nr:hypothetical protein [Chloroflexota bacterium]